MAKRLQAGLNMQVVLYFARNVEEELTTNDIALKFSVEAAAVHMKLKPSVQDGILGYASNGRGQGKQAVYSAGPELLRIIGLTKSEPEACLANDNFYGVVVR